MINTDRDLPLYVMLYFSSSLGLAVAPRVRFLQKRLEGKSQVPKCELNASDEDPDRKIKEEIESDNQNDDSEYLEQKPKLSIFDSSIQGIERCHKFLKFISLGLK